MQDDEIIEDEVVIEEMPPKRIRFPAITFNGKTYDSIVLRAPPIVALEEAGKKPTNFAGLRHLIHRVSGLPEAVCQLLDPRVIGSSDDYFARFTPPAPKAGGDAPSGA